MASKRTVNRLYWSLVNAHNDRDDNAIIELHSAITRAVAFGMPDSKVLTDDVVDHLDALEEIHGPAGIRQIGRARPRDCRQQADAYFSAARQFAEITA